MLLISPLHSLRDALFESFLHEGMSPIHGVSPSAQPKGITGCYRQHLLSSPICLVRSPNSGRTFSCVFELGSRDLMGDK